MFILERCVKKLALGRLCGDKIYQGLDKLMRLTLGGGE